MRPVRRLLYLAGPYSLNPAHCTHEAIMVGRAILDNPRIGEFFSYSPVIPHLTFYWDSVAPMEYERWLDYDLDVLHHCEAIVRLPGKSSGADIELAYAMGQGKDVFTFEQLPKPAQAAWTTR